MNAKVIEKLRDAAEDYRVAPQAAKPSRLHVDNGWTVEGYVLAVEDATVVMMDGTDQFPDGLRLPLERVTAVA